MSKLSKFTRRAALQGAAMIPFAVGSFAQGRASNSNVLVAYFSRTGNTRVIAGQISRSRNAGLFEIRPRDAYPEDYEETVAQAQRERDTRYEPPLNETVSNIDRYDVIFLGFSVWGTTAPPVIRSFLSAHDLSGRTLVPFITHGGYGAGSSLDVLAENAREARRLEPFVLEADQERRTLSEVTQWLGGVDLPARR